MNSNLVRTLKRTGWVLGCATGALAACNVYDTSLLVAGDAGGNGGSAGNSGGTGGGAATGGTGASGGTGGGTGGSGGGSTDKFWNDMEVGDPGVCPTEGRPDKSMRPKDTAPGDVGPVFVGWNRMRFGAVKDLKSLELDANAWKDVGFNLDRSCNSATWPEGVLSGAAVDTCGEAKLKACKNSLQNTYDGNYCKDNAVGLLFGIASVSPILGEPFRLTEPDYNCALHRGSFSVIFKISQYNGELNDESVRFDLYSSVGVSAPAAWNCRPSTQSGLENALIDNWQTQADQVLSKKWQFALRDIDPAAPEPPPGDPVKNSKWSDAAAYVRNGWVIAELPPNAEMWFNGLNAHTPGIRLIVQNTVIAAQLVKDRQSELWSITEGTVGGTIKPGDMINSFREIGFCENGCDSYTTVIGYMNQTTDMLSGSNEAVPDSTCDALSFGVDFTAKQVTPGPTIAVPAPPDVTGGKCGTPPENDDIGKPGCVCPIPPEVGPCTLPDAGN